MDDADDAIGNLTPQQVGGQTKRARNREKLIHAVEFVMRPTEQGMAATVGNICNDAGISAATFYTFYKSRNELCADAVRDLVLKPLFDLRPSSTQDSVDQLFRLCRGRHHLVAAALAHRYDPSPPVTIAAAPAEFAVVEKANSPSIPSPDTDDLVVLLAYVLNGKDVWSQLRDNIGLSPNFSYWDDEGDPENPNWDDRYRHYDKLVNVLLAAAVFLWDCVATQRRIPAKKIADMLTLAASVQAKDFQHP